MYNGQLDEYTYIHLLTVFILFIIMTQYRNRFMHSDVYKSGETAVDRDRFDITKNRLYPPNKDKKNKNKIWSKRENWGDKRILHFEKLLSCRLYFSCSFIKQAYCKYLYCKNCWPTFLSLGGRTAQNSTHMCYYCNND